MLIHRFPSIFIWLIDGSGSRAYVKVSPASAHSPQELLESAKALANALPTSCFVYGITVQYITMVTPLGEVDLESDVTHGATLLFELAGGDLQNINLPAILPEYIGADGIVRPLPDLQPLLEVLQAGPFTDGLGRPYGAYLVGGATNEITMAPQLGDI